MNLCRNLCRSLGLIATLLASSAGVAGSLPMTVDDLFKVKRLGDQYLIGTEHTHNNWRLVKEYNLSKHLLALSHVFDSLRKKAQLAMTRQAKPCQREKS